MPKNSSRAGLLRIFEVLKSEALRYLKAPGRLERVLERAYVVSRCQLLLLLETDPTILVDSFEPRDYLLYAGNMAESIPTSPVEHPNLACLSVQDVYLVSSWICTCGNLIRPNWMRHTHPYGPDCQHETNTQENTYH